MVTLDGFFKAVRGEVSDGGAWRFVEEVHRNDRLSTHAAFNRTAEYLADTMRRLGMVDVELIKYPTNGKTLVGDWMPSPAWDAEYGCLEVLDPSNLAGILQRYPETNTCLAINSGPTPPGGLTAQLVDVEAPGAPQSLKGKIALISVFASGLRPELIRRGAVAIVSDGLRNPKSRMQVPEAVAWENVWHEPWDRPRCPVMNVNGYQGQALRAALAKGATVVVKMIVKARNYRGHLLTATGVIPGRNRDEELVGIAHASEVGANDNASGCGGLLETARTLIALQKKKAIGRLRRSIRLVFPFECYGTVGWLTRSKRTARILGGLCPDMIGESFDKAGSTLNAHCSGDATPGPGNALIFRVLDMVRGVDDRYRYIEKNPMIDDNAFIADPNVGGPTPAMVMQPDPAYHSNLDTMDKVDPVVLGLSTTAVATYLGYLASAGSAEAAELADLTFYRMRRRLDAMLRDLPTDAVDRDPHPAVKIHTLADVGAEHIEACLRYATAAGTVKRLAADWRADCDLAVSRMGWTGVVDVKPPAAALQIPVRKEKYLPAGDRMTRAEKKQFSAMAGTSFPWSSALAEALYLTNGERTIAQIHRRVALRCGFSLEKLVGAFKAMDKFGYVKLAKAR